MTILILHFSSCNLEIKEVTYLIDKQYMYVNVHL